MIENVVPLAFPDDAVALFPLSAAQRRLWLAERLEPGPAYNVPLALDLAGSLDRSALERALERLVERHEALRTSVAIVDGEAYQAIHPAFRPSLRVEQVGAAQLQTRLERIAAEPCDLLTGPALRAVLFETGAQRATLLLVLHHLVCDGWSVGVLLADLRALYAEELGEGVGPGEPPFQYADYSEWRREQRDSPEDVAHWDARFAAAPAALDLRTRDGGWSAAGGAVSGELSAELMAEVRRFAASRNTTAFFVLLTSYALLAARRAASHDVTIAVPVANRTRMEFERTVGLFVNTLPMRLRVPATVPLAQLVRSVQAGGLADLDHQGLAYEEILRRARLRHGEGLAELATVMFAFQNAPFTADAWPGLRVAPHQVENGGAKFDLVLRVDPQPDGSARTTLEYRSSHFGREDAQAMLDGFARIVTAVVRTPEAPALAVALLPAPERASAIALSAGAGAVAVRPEELASWFAASAAAAGERVALRCGEAELSYAELERRSAALARALRRQGVSAEVRVGLACERGIGLLVGMLGILRAGGAYVPLDPSYPASHLAYLVADSGVRLVVADAAGEAALGEPGVPVLRLGAHAQSGGAEPLPAIDPEQAAYVIYTSGSTGAPKGCVVSHRNVARLLAGCEGWLEPGAQDVWTLFHSYAFDFSVWEIWGALLYGGTLAIVPRAVARDPAALLELLAAQGVTVLSQTPSAFRQLAAAEAEAEEPVGLALRWVVFGGEALEPGSLAGWVGRQPAVRLMNMYGITETTVHVTARELQAAEVRAGVPSLLGRALGDLRLLLLDEALEPVPAGALGELCVGGAGVSRGYLGRPALTAQRFVPDPFGSPGARLYRSGDLGRRGADGDVAYCGRADQQVKIRGFRVELGEITAALLAHPDLADAAVLAPAGPAGPRLVGWIVGRSGRPDPAAVRSWLAQRLPEHLVPAVLVPLERLPLTANGKLDPGALPAPGHLRAAAAGGDAPQTPTEVLLAGLWAEVLGLPAGTPIARDANFFAGGGDSIIALRLIAAAKRHGMGLRARDIFSHPTLAGLAAAAGRTGSVPEATTADAPEGALTPIEHWFFGLELSRPSSWAQAVHMRLREGVDPAAVQDALERVVALHPAFAVRYRTEPEGRQARSEPFSPRLASRRFPAGTSLPAVAAELLEALDLERGPLAAIGWIGDGDAVLTIHHLLVDTLSWYILFSDLADALAGTALQAPTAGRMAWCAALAAAAERADSGYWQTMAAELGRVPSLPARVAGAGRYRDAIRHDHTVGAAAFAAFEAAVARGAIPEELLLAATLLTLGEATGSGRVAVTLERHGRDGVSLDTSRSVGWHTALAPFVADVSSQATPERALGVVIEALCRWAPRASEYLTLRAGAAGAALGERLKAVGLPEFAFNYLGRMTLPAEGPIDVVPLPELPLHDPEGERPFAHELIAWSDGTGLHFAWIFNGRAVEEAAVERWLARIEYHLEPLARVAAGEIVELSATPLQQGLIFHTVNDRGPGAYLQQVTAELHGHVDPGLLRAAWQRTLATHDALTAAFGSREDGTMVQRFAPGVAAEVEVLDLTSVDPVDRESLLDAYLAADRSKGLALDRAPLMRLTLAQLAEDRWWLLWTHHHAIVDGWSLPVVLETLLQAYDELREGRRGMPARGRSYASYLRWRLGQDEQALAAAWRANLAALEEPARMRLPRPDAPEEGTAQTRLEVPAALVEAASRFAAENGATLNSVFLAAWAATLRLLVGSDHLVLGVTLSGRHADVPEIERMVGLFINTVPLALHVVADRSPVAWVGEVQRALAAVQDVAHAGLADIQRWAGFPGQPLFDTLYVFENYPTLGTANGAFSVSNVQMHERAHYALTLAVVPGPPFELRLEYDLALVDPLTAEAALESLQAALRGMVARPSAAVGSLPVLGAAAAARLEDWIHGPPPDLPLPGAAAFAAVVAARPQAVAIDDGDRTVSYAQLGRMVDAVAARLRALGIGAVPGREDVVGICMTKSIAAIAAQLAIWHAGAAFLPLDCAHPPERLADCLRLADARLVLLDEVTAELGLGASSALVGADWLEPAPDALPFPPADVAVDALAYVIFTSGSTGRPKGVAVTHRGIRNLMRINRDAGALKSGDRLFYFASPAFDGAIAEVLMTLGCGATLVLPPGGRGAMEFDLIETLRGNRANNVTFPPALLSALDPTAFDGVTTLLVAGAAAGGALFRTWAGGRRIFNAYGPCEATVSSSVAECTHLAGEPTLGRPNRGVEMHLLGPDLQQVPPGVPGEIFLGGIGLARGYLFAPRLTAAAFVPDPFGPPGSRLYRTGDRGARTAEGAIRFLGRSDQQVKLRGFRVEPAEVEAELMRGPGVAHAVALVEGEGRAARLLGFVQGFAGSQPPGDELREALSRRLPSYLLPVAIYPVAEWPRMPNGKIDRAGLLAAAAAFEADRPADGDAAAGVLGHTLAELWGSVLARDTVGLEENFFDLGGDSIGALQIAARARRAGLKLLPRDVLECQTVAALVARLRAAGDELPAQAGAADAGTAPLLPAQRWFFEQIDVRPERFLMSVELELDFAPDPVALQSALDALVAAHDALRSTYDLAGIHPVDPSAAGAMLHVLQAQPGEGGGSAAARFATLKAGIDPARGPAFVAALANGPAPRFLLAVHHLATDAVSMRVLIDDLWTAYAAASARAPARLRAPGTTLAGYARALARAASEGAFLTEIPYWTEVLRPSEALDLRAVGGPTREPDTRRCRAEEPLDGTPPGAAVEAALLAGLWQVLGEEGRGRGLIVEREGHGRDGLPGADVSRTVGWFTAIHPFRLENGDPDRIATELARIPSGGAGYGALTRLAGHAELRTGAACWVGFNYLGALRTAGELPARLATDPSGGDQDPLQRRARPLEVRAWSIDETLVLEWIADTRLGPAFAQRVHSHCAAVRRLLRNAERRFDLDPDEMAALLEDLSPVSGGEGGG